MDSSSPPKNAQSLLDFKDLATAAFRIRSSIPMTDCYHSKSLSEFTGSEIWLKMETRHETGSFKERGALNALLSLTVEQRKLGVICASAGNHALALAYHGKRLGIPVTVVMPTIAPLTKVNRCGKYGAKVHVVGADIYESFSFASDIAKKENLQYINGFNDLPIIAGAGTCALEILEQVSDVDAIVIPVGGGGLIAGMSLAIKTLQPHVKVIGAEPTNCRSFAVAMEAGEPIDVELKPTLADGLAVRKVGSNAFAIGRHYIDQCVDVSDKFTALAVLRMLEEEKTVTEGAGAQALAVMLHPNVLSELRGKRVVVCICGGNIDTQVLSRVINRGLSADHRLLRVTANIEDKPGGLLRFAETVAKAGASVKDLTHVRGFTDSVSTVSIVCTIETRNKAHAVQLMNELNSCFEIADSSFKE